MPTDRTGNAPPEDREILMGYVASAHGIKGEVVIKSFTEPPDNIASYGTVTARNKKTGQVREISITACRETSKGLVSRIKGVADRNAADALKGCELLVSRAALPDADQGEFYHEDLVGLTAVDADGQAFGRVHSVENYGAGDLLDIELSGDRSSELVPFTHAHVPEVRPSEGVVVINWPLRYEIAQGPETDNEENAASLSGPKPE